MAKTDSKLPPLTHEPLLWVDMTPDADFVLRILRAYRHNCSCKWTSPTGSEPADAALRLMNEACDKRAALLDSAIDILTP